MGESGKWNKNININTVQNNCRFSGEEEPQTNCAAGRRWILVSARACVNIQFILIRLACSTSCWEHGGEVIKGKSGIPLPGICLYVVCLVLINEIIVTFLECLMRGCLVSPESPSFGTAHLPPFTRELPPVLRPNFLSLSLTRRWQKPQAHISLCLWMENDCTASKALQSLKTNFSFSPFLLLLRVPYSLFLCYTAHNNDQNQQFGTQHKKPPT